MDVTETSAGNSWELSEDGCYVGLTEGSLDAKSIMDKVRSPAAGAIVLFAGTTRDNFAGKPVRDLKYTAYQKLALKLIAVSSPHRQAAWRAGEEALEECKSRVEIWKLEEFEGDEGVWRANRDGAAGQRVNET